MAARENQGLQIALIIFVMLTMVLAVTTYMFFHNFQEQEVKSIGLAADVKKGHDEKAKLIENWHTLRQLHAGPLPRDEMPTDVAAVELATVELKKEFDDIIAKYGSHVADKKKETEEGETFVYTNKNCKYPFLVTQYFTEQEKKNGDLVVVSANVEKLTSDLGVSTQANKGEIDLYHAAVAKHNTDLGGERTRFTGDITAKQDQVVKLASAKDTAEQAVNAAKQQITTITNTLNTKIAKLQEELTSLAKVQNSKRTEISEAPQGKLLFVNQTNRTATINLGSLDGLRKQIVFTVYAAGDSNIAKAKPKGKLEVIQLESAHSATCRILEDDLKNPLMPQDLIYSPIWQPGQIEHFAIAGLFDVDGDGKSDRQLIVDLIKSSGGAVDSQLDEKGKIEGRISLNTQFLIVGDRPTEKTGNPEMLNGFTRMLNEADRLGVQQMPVYKFLLHVGYTPERAGKGGSTTTSGTGTVDNTFRPRTPPRGAGGGAFDK